MLAPYKSFEDRGVHVGFRARTLQAVRCRQSRQDSHIYEAMIRNRLGQSGRAGDLVMEFRNLPDWSEINDRDRMLYDRVLNCGYENEGYLDPIIMRQIRLELDLEFGDRADKRAAEEELAQTKADAQMCYLEILAMLGRHAADDSEHDILSSLSRPVLLQLADQDEDELHRLVRMIAGRVAAEAGMSRAQLQERLESVSDFATPISSMVAQEEDRAIGYLSRQLKMMENLYDELAEQAELEGATGPTSVVRANMASFLVYANSMAGGVKDCILNLDYFTNDRKYQRMLDVIAEQRKRISYSLDGWTEHAERWADIDQDDQVARSKFIADLMRDMPLAPAEVTAVHGPYSSGLCFSDLRGAVVKELHSWANDELDTELAERVKEGKKRNLIDDTVQVFRGDRVRTVHVKG